MCLCFSLPLSLVFSELHSSVFLPTISGIFVREFSSFFCCKHFSILFKFKRHFLLQCTMKGDYVRKYQRWLCHVWRLKSRCVLKSSVNEAKVMISQLNKAAARFPSLPPKLSSLRRERPRCWVELLFLKGLWRPWQTCIFGFACKAEAAIAKGVFVVLLFPFSISLISRWW